MNTELLATFECLLTIVAPLLILYLRGQWPLRVTVLCVVTLPILWYLTYSPLHELSHVIGTYLVGGKVTYVKLIPRFWAGEFSRAWVTTEGIEKSWQQLVSTGFPYMLDVVCAVVGYYLRQAYLGRMRGIPRQTWKRTCYLTPSALPLLPRVPLISAFCCEDFQDSLRFTQTMVSSAIEPLVWTLL